jgi:threonine dehydrogenase-like Zn-dependent dehydrogenase
VLHDFGDMRLEDVPEPRDVPAGWVKLRILTAEPAITECLLYRGNPTYNIGLVKEKLAAGPTQLFGHEYCGQIVELGEGVEDLSLGDRVASRSVSACGKCYLCVNDRIDECQKGPIVGFDIPGCFAEYCLVPANSVVPVPDSVSDLEATAIQPLTDAAAGVAAAPLSAGDTCLVIGQGVMGLGAMQVARVSGAGTIIVSDVRDVSLDMARELGASIVVDARKDDPVEVAMDLTKGEGVDVVIDCAGGPPGQGLAGSLALHQAIAAVKDCGTIVGTALYGDTVSLPIREFRHRSIHYVFPAILTRKLLSYVVDLVASDRVRLEPTITKVLEGIENVEEAFRLTEDKTNNLINPVQVVIGRAS